MYCLQALFFFYFHIKSAKPGTPGFKQTAEGMESHRVSLHQQKCNKEKLLGDQA